MPVGCEQVSGIVNSYEAVTDVFPCAHAVRVLGTTGLKSGQRVVMMQMKGARITETPDSTYGNILDVAGAGAAEYLTVQRVNNDTVVFTTSWVHEYSAAGTVQLIRVAQYGDAQIIGGVYAKSWNGITGGVIAIDVDRVLVLDANIDASGTGFRGGAASVNKDTCGTTIWTAPVASGAGGAKGESIVATSNDLAGAGRAARATGGGGGNGANAGGAGGGNGGRGGSGGDANSWCNPYAGAGGRGGASLASSVPDQHFFLGGGGGGAHQNNQQGTNGVSGGGVVLIRAQTILVNKGAILCRGTSVPDTAAWKSGLPQQPGDGAGGGGAGGTVVVDASVITGTLVVDVRGGNGGNQGARYQSNGPGGGGGGGVLVMPTRHPAVKPLLEGGLPGIHVSPETGPNVYKSPWGASAGDSGVVITPFTWRTYSPATLAITGPDRICKGDSAVLTATAGFRRYQWSNGQTGQEIVVRSGGTYSVVVTDSSGCTNQTASLTVQELPSLPYASRSTIDFGVIEIGSTSSATVMLKHTGEGWVTITGMTPPAGVRLVRPASFPIVLARDSVEVELEITGTVDATIDDSLIIAVMEPCPGSRYIRVIATVNKERSTVIVGNVTSKAGMANVPIPISFQHDSPTPEIRGAHALLHVSLDSRLYVPTGVTKGALVSSTVDSVTHTRYVVIDVDNIAITKPASVCTELLGSTLLAPNDSCLVVVDSVEWLQVDRKPLVTDIPGLLVVQAICYPGSRPITLLDAPLIRVRPQPASDGVTVDLHPTIGSISALEVRDVQGRIVAHSEGAVHIGTQHVADGVYQLVVTTTAGSWVGSIVVQR